MPEEIVQPVVEAEKPFDFAAWKAKQNAPGTPAQAEEPAKVEAKPEVKAAEVEDIEEDHTPKLPRSVRRELNDLRRKLGVAEGQLAMVKELQAQGFTKAEAKAEVAQATPTGEPTRDQFATDAEYYKAVAKFEVRAEMAKGQQSAAQESEQREFMAGVSKATEKFNEDVAQFPDWADVVEAMHDVPIDAKKQETFVALVAKSDQRAAILYHLAKNPVDREMLFAMSPSAQIAYFHRLEGRMEAKYVKKEEPTEKKKPTTAELDAKKAKPSESVRVAAGKAAEGAPSMMLADGRTLNPAWKAAQNAAAGLRP